jgi:tetratricopeptide (TPR) repeat protein
MTIVDEFRHSTRALLAVALITTGLAAPLASQGSTPYEIYRNAVAGYVKSGDISTAVAPLQQWSRKEFDTAIKATIDGSNASELRAAAVFQLEIGVAVVGLSSDAAAGHFNHGSALLDRWTNTRFLVRPAEGEDEKAIRATWYGVAGSAFAAVKDINRARPLLSKAQSIQPRSARAHALLATLKELQASLLDPEDAPTLSRRERNKRDRGVLLYQAQQEYQRALRYDENYSLALIRLGRVLHLGGDPKEARQTLERGQRLAKDPSTQYLAALFMGELNQAESDVIGARQSFEQAVAIAPTSQPATIALAHLEIMAGRPDRASALAHRLAEASVAGLPWWVYHYRALDIAGLRWLRERIMQ